jgi:hypothetical protein
MIFLDMPAFFSKMFQSELLSKPMLIAKPRILRF